MQRLGVLVSMFVMVGVAAAQPAGSAAPPQEWTLAPPDGWQRNAAAEQMTVQRLQKIPGYNRLDVRVWSPGDQSGAMILQSFVLPLDRASVMRQIDEADAGTIDGFAEKSKRTSQPQRIVGSQIFRDVRVDELRGVPMRARMARWYQPASDGLHVLIVTCLAKVGPMRCDPSVDAARFTVAKSVPLEQPAASGAGAGAGMDNTASAMGYLAGKLMMSAAAIAVLIVVVVLLRRRSSSKPRRR